MSIYHYYRRSGEILGHFLSVDQRDSRKQCSRTGRICTPNDQESQLRIRRYRPSRHRPRSSPSQGGVDKQTIPDNDQYRPNEDEQTAMSTITESTTQPDQQFQQGPDLSSSYIPALGSASLPAIATATTPSVYTSAGSAEGASSSNILSSAPGTLHQESPGYPGANEASLGPASTPHGETTALSRREAYLVRHYVEHLGRWLDCTDASRQFTLKIATLAKQSPILLHAVTSYAAKHMRDSDTADQEQQKSIGLLIPLLSSEAVADDEATLCAIVILRVFEQLNGESPTAVIMPRLSFLSTRAD